MTTVAKARAAGIFNLLMLPFGAISLIGRLPSSSDAAVTATNLLAHSSAVYRGFLSDLLVVATYVAVTALLYELFKPVNSTVSLAAALFSLLGCTVLAVTALFRVAPLAVLNATGIKREQAETLAYLLLKLYSPAYGIGFAFFGFYMTLIGWLVYKSTFMPRFLGVLVMISGCAGLTFLWPPLAKALWPRVIMTLDVGEFALMLWLAFKGVDERRSTA